MGPKEEIIGAARKSGRTVLTEVESKLIISAEGIEVVETRTAHTQKEAVTVAREIGFPLAMKIVSPGISHKSDVGGVMLGVQSVAGVRRAYRELRSIPGLNGGDAQGVSVQSMARPGVEVIVGMSRDAQFGPVIMFGLGGVFVELLRDVSFRVVPLQHRDAATMIREIRGYPLLKGYRGVPPADVESLENLLVKVSSFVELTPEVRELDLNPVIAGAAGAVVADARIVIGSPDN